MENGVLARVPFHENRGCCNHIGRMNPIAVLPWLPFQGSCLAIGQTERSFPVILLSIN